MRVLLDTNIIIKREDNNIISESLQILMKILNQLNIDIILHPKTTNDIKKDKDQRRKKITLSKFQTYNMLKDFPEPANDSKFIDIIGKPKKDNDEIDNYLIYAVYRDAVNFLITEDIGIHKKSEKLDISDRILSILDAIGIFKQDLPKEKIKLPYVLKSTTMSNLKVEDPIFNTLREEYPEFNKWFKRKSREGRKCWVYYRNTNELGAVLIYKFEEERIQALPTLPKKRRIKIATMIVSYTGQKIGELFIKLSVNLAVENEIPEIYLTHFSKKDDHLVNLIEDFGFLKLAIINHEWSKVPEDVFVKKIYLTDSDVQKIQPIQISLKHYPNFYDGKKVNKHIVPILPKYHDRLFTDFPQRKQLTIDETLLNEFIIEGNTIKKAYLSHSSTKKIDRGDIIIFYRSQDIMGLVSLGIVEKVFYDLTDKESVINLVGKRTVYSISEVENFVEKKTMIILFNHHFHLKKTISYQKLLEDKILKGAPQSITKIDHENYLKIKKIGGFNERFTFN